MGLTPKQNVIKVMYDIKILGPPTHQSVQKCTSYMESLLPYASTTKLWNYLPDFIKNITYFIIIQKAFERIFQ